MVLKSLTLINVFAKILSYFGLRKYLCRKDEKNQTFYSSMIQVEIFVVTLQKIYYLCKLNTISLFSHEIPF